MSSLWTKVLDPHCDADVAAALSIFQQAFIDAWSAERLRSVLMQRSISALLAGSGDTAAACLIEYRFRTGRRIVSVGVLQDSAGLGYASSLIREVQRRVLQSPSQYGVSAYIPVDNPPALACFQKSGFQSLLTVPGYYEGRAARLMSWSRDQPCGNQSTAIPSSATSSLRIV